MVRYQSPKSGGLRIRESARRTVEGRSAEIVE